MQPTDFEFRLERARASGLPLLDLTESDPARCGLGWRSDELASVLAAPRAGAPDSTPAGLAAAQDAVASYLAGKDASIDPDRVFFARSRAEARSLALDAGCEREGEILAPSPARPFLEPAAAAAARLRSYALTFDGAWRLDRRSLEKAGTPSTSAIVVGNPADPTGALVSRDELSFLEDLCSDRGLTLVAEESSLDTALEPSASVVRVTRCLGVHVSGITGVCGLPQLQCEWIAVAGPDRLAHPALRRLRSAERADLPASSVLLALPSLLARRERFLGALRARLARNRSVIAASALREAPWTLQWGGGGWWAVLQINPVQDTDELCSALLDSGVVVSPGHLDGFPREGYLAVSLLPPPAVFDEALHRLEVRLRGSV